VHIDEQTILYFGCLVVAVILHEISHGVVALRFGDRTAKDAGRLTLNPVPHIDPFGTIVLPAMGAIVGLPVFGYAKPVPVNPNRLHQPRRDMLYVSLAGPATNLTLMLVAAISARLMYEHGPRVFTYDQLPLGTRIVFTFAVVNLLLGVFNLLPIPPLDGSALLERVLPARWLPSWYKFRPYGLLVLFAIIFMWSGALSTLLDPLTNHLFNWVFH
jgi:Zn-dependent protease